MQVSDFLLQEWKPALGCTEPASIAYAAATAAAHIEGKVKNVHLICDPRIFKNCYAVGIPHSKHKTGIRWALAIGALLPTPGLKLECFNQITPKILKGAHRLIQAGAVTVDVDTSKEELFVDCRVNGRDSTARATIELEHTRLVRLEINGSPIALEQQAIPGSNATGMRQKLSELSSEDLTTLSASLTDTDRLALNRGVQLNMAIATHGMSLFPKKFVDLAATDPLGRYSKLVCAGVYARMLGENFVVMSLAGSGNKGITASVPLYAWGQDHGIDQDRLDEALALACLFTSFTTHYLGTLSAVCGCSNAAGIGLAAGLVYAQGGGTVEISHAINNMVGNVTGMICDGAKIGCALKTMTSVDAAFRSASLAMNGVGIPDSDGIIGKDGISSISNLGIIATKGMVSMDVEILQIMQDKMKKSEILDQE